MEEIHCKKFLDFLGQGYIIIQLALVYVKRKGSFLKAYLQ